MEIRVGDKKKKKKCERRRADEAKATQNQISPGTEGEKMD